MSTFKEISANDVKVARSFLDQIVDVIQNDVSGADTRQAYQHFVTGGVGSVTSSLWQTVHDQDFSLETANPVFDMTVGLYVSSTIVTDAKTGTDSSGKLLFSSQSMMMREKVFMYRQFAQKLLGDADSRFTSPFGSSTSTDNIDAALFIPLKRLHARDQVKRETFVMGFYKSASTGEEGTTRNINAVPGDDPSSFQVFTDVGAATNKAVTFGGQVSDVVDASDTDTGVGLLFNDAGVLVLDLKKVLDETQAITGAIDAMRSGVLDTHTGHGQTPVSASFVSGFMVSASIDDIVDHLASTRFGSGTLSAMTYQNITNINSTIITTRLGADEFNYSSHPTFIDNQNRIVVIDEGQEETQKSFTMLTTVGFYDANDNLLAVAKLSRPIEKNDERDILLRTRIDF